jgi:hypothetical protein
MTIATKNTTIAMNMLKSSKAFITIDKITAKINLA